MNKREQLKYRNPRNNRAPSEISVRIRKAINKLKRRVKK